MPHLDTPQHRQRSANDAHRRSRCRCCGLIGGRCTLEAHDPRRSAPPQRRLLQPPRECHLLACVYAFGVEWWIVVRHLDPIDRSVRRSVGRWMCRSIEWLIDLPPPPNLWQPKTLSLPLPLPHTSLPAQLLQHKMTLLRDKKTTSRDFRHLLRELTLYLGCVAWVTDGRTALCPPDERANDFHEMNRNPTIVSHLVDSRVGTRPRRSSSCGRAWWRRRTGRTRGKSCRRRSPSCPSSAAASAWSVRRNSSRLV